MTRAVLLLPILAASLPAGEPGVIPRPFEMRVRSGQFVLSEGNTVQAPAGLAEMAVSALSAAVGGPVKAAPAGIPGKVQFLSANTLPDSYPIPSGEGYVIRVTPEVVNIHAATAAGHFYGLKTLSQMLAETGAAHTLPCGDIVDAPRFAWRGYMLDESRHFTGVEGVKRLLDAMAEFKLNRFHWHLTDSAGWRIEIKKYPKLTSVGGKGSETDRSPEAAACFYTQEQIKDIVAYAKARFITIVPEIDMPGHADAAVLSYPEHSGGGFEQNGSKEKWPNFTFNPARPGTLAFLDDILAEVAALFPEAGLIHFGGDEVHFGWKKWTGLTDVKDLMARENLKDLAGVEAWFNRRMASRINQLGFSTGGWDEIAARGLPRDKTVVFWWRHDKPKVLREALDAGYPVVLCPRRPLYFDFVQHDSHKTGRRWGGFNPLSDVYAFPDSLGDLKPGDENHILGLQANLWTETTVTQERRDFLTWPRLVAVAEAAWTPKQRKDFPSFEERLKPQLARLRSRGLAPWDPWTLSPEVGK